MEELDLELLTSGYSKIPAHTDGNLCWKIKIFLKIDNNLLETDLDHILDSICKKIRAEYKEFNEKA